MSTWKDISHISKLKVTNLGGADNAVIYANSRHQVAIEVTLEPRNSKNEVISIPSSEIANHIKLVDYNNYDLPRSFTVTDYPGAYVTPVPSDAGNFTSGFNKAILYLRVSPGYASNSIKMAVQCTVNKDQYTTSENNNNNNAVPNTFTLRILETRVFTDIDLKVTTHRTTPTNCEYTCYYVSIHGSSARMAASGPDDNKRFNFRSSGGWRGECFSMGRYTVINKDSEFWHHEGQQYIPIHQQEGICFLSARTWGHGVMHWDDLGSEVFQIYDKYGNLLTFRANPDNDCFINFNVI